MVWCRNKNSFGLFVKESTLWISPFDILKSKQTALNEQIMAKLFDYENDL